MMHPRKIFDEILAWLGFGLSSRDRRYLERRLAAKRLAMRAFLREHLDHPRPPGHATAPANDSNADAVATTPPHDVD